MTESYPYHHHLGNVLSTISDRKIAVAGTAGLIDHWRAEVHSFADYYPFGMQMEARTGFTEGYRFGFNGKENDNEVAGNGNLYNYGFRFYNSRLGKFLSVDPLASDYPWYTPYQFAGNKPIWATDLDGLEEHFYTDRFLNSQIGRSVVRIASQTTIAGNIYKALKSQHKYDLYYGTFDSYGATDEIGAIIKMKIEADGHPTANFTARGYTLVINNEDDLDTRSAYLSRFTKDEMNQIRDRVKSKDGGVIVVLVADQMLNPSDNKKSDRVESIFKKNTLRTASNTSIHESGAHVLPYLLNENYEGDLYKEHKDYHGKPTYSSPSVKDYNNNPTKYKGTKFSQTMQ